MSFDRIFFCRFCPANFFAGAVAWFSLVFVANVLAQEAVGTSATSAPSSQPVADHSEDDAVQHLIRLQGQHQFARLTVTLAEEIAILDGTDLRSVGDLTAPGIHANTDVSGRTKFQTYRTSMNASYDLSGKTFLSTGFNSLVTEYDSSSLFSSANFSENLFINYRYSDKVVVGIGGTGGYDVVDDPNPAQTFEQANARISYQTSSKICVNVS